MLRVPDPVGGSAVTPQGAAAPKLSRRSMLQGAGAVATGLILGVGFPAEHTRATTIGEDASGARFNAFVHIAPDDSVTLTMPAVEMGQGAYTSTTLMLAEELDLALDRIVLQHAPVDQKDYGNPIQVIQITGGSTTTRGWYPLLRKAGATARAMLVSAAASGWGVAPGSLRTEDGTVFHDPSGRSVRYGALARRAAMQPVPTEVPLKSPADFRLMGKSIPRLDQADKVNGKLQFGIDVMLPGMRFATLAASPTFGGRVAHVDDSQAKLVPGVRQIIVLDDLVAVVGDHMWAAKQGLDALAIKWDCGVNAAVTQAQLWTELERASQQTGIVAKRVGDAARQMSGDGLFEASYELPYLAHAAMEPMNCTAHVRADSCEIWVGTQAPGKAQDIAAKEAGLRPDQVTLHNFLIGGGFGRRLEVDGIAKAVRIARHVDGPVKVVWTREEDIQQEAYRPLYRDRLWAKVDSGRVTAWHHRATGAAIIARYVPPGFRDGIDPDAVDGAVAPPYDFTNLLVEYVRHETPQVPTGFWRGVGPNSNVFAVECFLDRIAHETGADPVALRRGMLSNNPRARAVLDLAAEKAGWTSAPAAPAQGDRTGRGVALLSAFGSFLACVADVAIADEGDVYVTRVVTAVDVGVIVSPKGLEAQVQGGTVFGLSAVLHGDVTIDGGRVQQSNFHDYRVLRIDEMPAIETHFVQSSEAPGGIGEPGTVVVQPAVANAVYAATGVQLTRMPINRALLAKTPA